MLPALAHCEDARSVVAGAMEQAVEPALEGQGDALPLAQCEDASGVVAHAVQEVVDTAGAGLLPAAVGQALPGNSQGAEQEQEQETGSSPGLPEQRAALVQGSGRGERETAQPQDSPPCCAHRCFNSPLSWLLPSPTPEVHLEHWGTASTLAWVPTSSQMWISSTHPCPAPAQSSCAKHPPLAVQCRGTSSESIHSAGIACPAPSLAVPSSAAGYNQGVPGICCTLVASQETSHALPHPQPYIPTSHPSLFSRPQGLQHPSPTLVLGTSILPGVFRWPSGSGAYPIRQPTAQYPALPLPLYRAQHNGAAKNTTGAAGAAGLWETWERCGCSPETIQAFPLICSSPL